MGQHADDDIDYRIFGRERGEPRRRKGRRGASSPLTPNELKAAHLKGRGLARLAAEVGKKLAALTRK